MNTIPYGQQFVDEDDIAAMVDVLRSDWLTTGPKVEEFETAFAEFVGAKEAVAVCNGTAALHTAMAALDIGADAEVIVPPITFAATANAVIFQGGTPVFADVNPDNLLLDPAKVKTKITAKTKAVIAVDYAGHPCDYDELRKICDHHGLALVADTCHSLGAEYKGRKVGTLADLSAFSFHPVKHITTGEGGMIVTDNSRFAERMRRFRHHGISADHRQRAAKGTWYYEMVELGYNYRITDFQCALGLSQLKKAPKWLVRRREIAKRYDDAFVDIKSIEPLKVAKNVSHAYHLYVIKLNSDLLKIDRREFFYKLREKGIGVNVHYIPIHLHPFYQDRFGTGVGLCPIAEDAYERLITLPMFPGIYNDEVEYVIEAVKEVIELYKI